MDIIEASKKISISVGFILSLLIAPPAVHGAYQIFQDRDYGGARYTLGNYDRVIMVDG